MLSTRTETILKSIVGQYITGAIPVPSQSISRDFNLKISTATIRNEMAHLEQEGYIIRPHSSAGSVPSDKGYRYYVESLGDIKLPLAEQRRVSHVFHQVEQDIDEWLSLAVSLMSQMVQNMAIVGLPRSETCQLKHLEIVRVQDQEALVILVLNGTRVRHRLLTFDRAVPQPELVTIANRLSAVFSNYTASQITAAEEEFSAAEQEVVDCLVEVMSAEDNREYERHYLDGLHFILNQPEFYRDRPRVLNLMELAQQRNLIKNIVPSGLPVGRVQVIIGQENEAEIIRGYSVVVSHYGLPGEAMGTISVIGPTRMPYGHTIATVSYLSSVLSGLIARLCSQD